MSTMQRSAGSGGNTHACCAWYSLRMSFWTVPRSLSAGHALLLGRRDVEAEEDDRRPVDRHRDRDLVERDPVEERLHVGERRDGDAADADLAERARVVGVVPHERREVERDGEPVWPCASRYL
jgi:hypothetical protein